MEMRIDFNGFWKLATPADVAGLVVELYGEGAVRAAEQCMTSASSDHRYDDYCFWQSVHDRIVDAVRRHQAIPRQRSPS